MLFIQLFSAKIYTFNYTSINIIISVFCKKMISGKTFENKSISKYVSHKPIKVIFLTVD